MNKKTANAIKRLNSRRWLFRTGRRIKGAKALMGTETPEAVEALVALLQDEKEKVRQAGRQTLENLAGDACDKLCALWTDGRDQALEAILMKSHYLASRPLNIRYLSALKLGDLARLQSANKAGVATLLELLGDADEVVAGNARRVLESLTNQEGIDHLCGLWPDGRDETLEAILMKSRYVASRPLSIRYFSALKLGDLARLQSADKAGVTTLLELLGDTDGVIAGNARRVLESLTNRHGIDHLCALWANGRDQALEAIIKKTGYMASAPPLLYELTCFLTHNAPTNSVSARDWLVALKDRNADIAQSAVRYAKEHADDLDFLMVPTLCVGMHSATL